MAIDITFFVCIELPEKVFLHVPLLSFCHKSFTYTVVHKLTSIILIEVFFLPFFLIFLTIIRVNIAIKLNNGNPTIDINTPIALKNILFFSITFKSQTRHNKMC